MPGLAPGMMLLGRLFDDPAVIIGIDLLHRHDHNGWYLVTVHRLDRLPNGIGQAGTGLDEHDDLLAPLDFALPPVMRGHPRQDIHAGRKPPLDEGTPGPLRLDNRGPSR